ncbi:MAG: VOC family protein [bacterium]|nr:VOC family protein [bacterium]
MKESTMHYHDIVHTEFCVQNIPQAAHFFQQLFGWECFSSEMENYWFWKLPHSEEILGGITTCEESLPSVATTTVYVQVENIQTTIEKALALGGHCLVQETKISDRLGYFAIIAEPSGCQVGIWSKNPSKPSNREEK